MKTLRILFFIFSLFVFGFKVYAQDSEIKTRSIINGKLKLNKWDDVNIISPFVFFCTTDNYERFRNMWDSLYEGGIQLPGYKKDLDAEDYYQKRCNYWYKYHFNGRVSANLVPVDSDYAIIYNELKKVEKELNKTTITSFQMSESLFRVLSKYSSGICVLSDISDYYYTGKSIFIAYRDYSLIRIFVFNLRERKLELYNSGRGRSKNSDYLFFKSRRNLGFSGFGGVLKKIKVIFE